MQTIPIAGLDGGRELTQLVLGTDWWKPELMDRIDPLLRRFHERGGRAIDTAHIYGGGKSEQAVGQWLDETKTRDEFVIVSKCAHHDYRAGIMRVTPECIDADLAQSLQRLRVQTIDIYLMHRDDPAVEVGPLVECFNRHLEAGRIRAYGGSNWTIGRIEQLNAWAADHGMVGFSLSSPNLTLARANQSMWKDCLTLDPAGRAWHERTQLPLLSWSSQARGFFSGRFTPETVEANHDVARTYFNDDNWARLDRCRELAGRKGCEPIQVALAWVLAQPFPVAAAVGPQTPGEVDSCVAAAELQLSAEEARWLETGE